MRCVVNLLSVDSSEQNIFEFNNICMFSVVFCVAVVIVISEDFQLLFQTVSSTNRFQTVRLLKCLFSCKRHHFKMCRSFTCHFRKVH